MYFRPYAHTAYALMLQISDFFLNVILTCALKLIDLDGIWLTERRGTNGRGRSTTEKKRVPSFLAFFRSLI